MQLMNCFLLVYCFTASIITYFIYYTAVYTVFYNIFQFLMI